MKHKKLFTKLFIFLMVIIASLAGVYFAKSIEHVLMFTFISGISAGVVAGIVSDIIKKTII